MHKNTPCIILTLRNGCKQKLLWDLRATNEGEISVPSLQEQYQDETKDEFLSYIWDLGETVIGKKKLWQKLTTSHGFSAWWLTCIVERHPNFYGNALYEVFKLRALERYIQEVGSIAISVSNMPEHIANAIAEICQKRNIAFDIPKSRKSFLKLFLMKEACRFVKNCLMLAKTIKFALHWWVRVRKKFPDFPNITQQKSLVVGTWWPNYDKKAANSGIFLSHYLENVHEILDNSASFIHWFFIYAGNDDDIASEVNARNLLREKNTNCDMTFWEECLTLRDVIFMTAVWLRFMFILLYARKESRAKNLWRQSSCNMFPLLEASLYSNEASWHLLRNLFILKATMNYSEAIGPQSKAFTTSEMQFWERPFFWTQRKAGCQNLFAVVHSIITPFRYFYPEETWSNSTLLAMLPDKLLCNGNYALQTLIDNGFPQSKLGKIEAVRYLYLSDMRAGTPRKPKTLLVVTSYFLEETLSMLSSLGAALHSLSFPCALKIVIKPHPFLPVDNFVHDYLDCPATIVNGNIKDYLTQDSVVFVAAGTSVALLAAWLQLPMIVFGPENSFDMGGMASLKGMKYAFTSNDIKEALENPRRYSLPKDFFYLDKSLINWKKNLYEHKEM